MASSWFKFGGKKHKTHANGVTIKDEQAPPVPIKTSKSVTLAPSVKPEENITANGKAMPPKSKSVDEAAFQDDRYGLSTLEEALQSLADNSQPVVARSTPKGVAIDTSNFSAMKHCLFAEPVYDAMIKDSMNVCELLQHNLDDYIVEVRKSPAREIVNNSVNGQVVNGEKAK